MAIAITATPVDIPAGIRMTSGLLDFNGTTYAAGGLAVTNAQWGAGVGAIPNRAPDFVIFSAGSADDDADSDGATVFRYIKSSGKVSKYGDEALVDAAGLGEGDAAASSATAVFIAVWVTTAPSS